jgi:hypothetical protein
MTKRRRKDRERGIRAHKLPSRFGMAAVIGFLSVTGPQIGVGTAVRDTAAIGCKPDSGWWGAKDCDEIFAGVGPDEHR